MRVTVQRLPPSHNAACSAHGHGAVDEDAFALTRAANALSVCATQPCQTWRRSFFGQLSVGEPRSSRTPFTNAVRAMCATSVSGVVPSATIFAEPWDWEERARTASSQSCSAISWTWMCSPNSTSAPPRCSRHRHKEKQGHRPAMTLFAGILTKEVLPTHRNPQRRANGCGHAALLTQSLDNPSGVTHMTTTPAATTAGARRLKDGKLISHRSCRALTHSGNSSPRRRQI
jgi:hypothetical protein